MAFQVKIAEEKDMVILALEGKMDSASSDELSLGLEEIKRRGKKKIILLFRALEHMDDQGVASLSSFLKWAKRVDRQVKMAEVQPEVMRVLESEGLNPAYDSLVEAMKSYQENGRMVMGEEERDDGFEVRPRSGGSHMPLLVIGGGIFIFFVLIIIYMTRDGSLGIEELQKRVALLEERITQAGGQSKNLSILQERIEGLRKDFTEKTKLLDSELAKVRQEMESAQAKAASTTRPQVAQAPKGVKHHMVIQGETLFSVGKKYGVTVDDLRRLNNLKPNQTIGVGQKLIVSSP